MPGTKALSLPPAPPKPPKRKNRLFNEFIADEPSLELALSRARGFVACIKANPFGPGRCLTFAGISGNGKTLLCEMILAELRLNPWGWCGDIPRFVRSGQVLDLTARFFDLRQVSDGFKNGRYGLVEQMEGVSLAVLDDLGADYDPSGVMIAKVDRILRARRHKWTLVTVNLPLQEIAEKLDARIASFLIRDENQYTEITAPDFALRKARFGSPEPKT